MKRLWKAAVAAAGVALIAGPVMAASPAGATPPTGYGFDNTPHVIVGGGSDTTYKAMINITDLWDTSALGGCAVDTSVSATMNQCVPTGTPDTNTLGNFQHDTVAQAGPVGSGAGIASLNGFVPSSSTAVTYNGTVNPAPAYTGTTQTGAQVDFARSSRGPSTSGGNATGGNELTADTFWGYAQDGVEVTAFNSRGAELQGLPSPAISPTVLGQIYSCQLTTWDQVTGNAADAGQPIVVWGMNSSSGTYSTFRNYLRTAGGLGSTYDINTGATQGCIRHLTAAGTGNQFPLENDVKPLVNDPAALSASPTSVDNPSNWLWFGSFGVFSAFPYTSSFTRAGTAVSAIAAPINGVLPSTSGIVLNTYPIGRTLYHVTRKPDADCPKTGGVCNFTANPGPTLPAGGTDFNVAGATAGVGGAVREFTRFICRASAAQEPVDPFTGVNFFSEITAGINKAGFTTVPVALRTAGSRCQVLS